jgi:cation transport ATPase
MAKAAESSMVCPACGHKNSPIPENGRCVACGAQMNEPVKSQRGEDPKKRYQQDGFSPLWCVIALVVQAVLTAAIVVGLPMVISSLDFEGYYGMIIAIPVWFVGGMLLGMISPGKTFIEPVVASLLIALPATFYIRSTETVRTMPLFMYLLLAAIGVMFSLIGTYLGERIQMGPPPRPASAS